MNILLTGGAGFIGSYLAESLCFHNNVLIVDNLSTGKRDNIFELEKKGSLKFVKADCINFNEIFPLCRNIDTLFHFAANPEVKITSDEDTELSFSQNVLATKVMLEAARKSGVKKFVFASTSTIYGEPHVIPTPEEYGPLKPISIYGATKLASEALVMAYCSSFKMSGIILRFANIIGHRSSHGVIFDFYNKLQKNHEKIEILGDGTQKKSYLYIDDCINAIHIAIKVNGIDCFNIGSEDQVDVISIAKIIGKEMKVNPKLEVTGGVDGGRGWIGDVKKMLLGTSKIKKLGFKAKFTSGEAVKQTISEILEKKIN